MGRVDWAVQQVTAAVVVVGLAFGAVRKHVVSLLHGPKSSCRVVSVISVGVVERGFLAERFFDIGQGCAACQAKGGVVV